MNDREQYKRIISFGSSIMIIALLTGVFAMVWYFSYSENIMLPFYRKGNWMVIGIYLVLMVLFYRAYGGYRIGYLTNTDAIYSQCLSTVCVNIITYCNISLIGRQFMSLMPMLILTLSDFVIIILWTLTYSKIYKRLYPPRRMIVVYGSHLATSLVGKMSRRTDKFLICESISVSEGTAKIIERILHYDGVVICDVPSHVRNDILKLCFKKSIRAYVSPKISDIIIRGATDMHLFDTPILLCKNNGLRFEQRLVKRIFDIVVAGLGFVLLSPFMLITAIAIKMYDGGNILYKQTRLTIEGRKFSVYKFRSMIADAEKDGIPRLATDDDVRITPVGEFIRKCRLDEFPQLINVLKGDMSLVGPRPERPELTEQYEKTMPEFGFRLNVKAGLTGYAQVMGKYDTTPYDKLKMDLMYIEKYSVLLDIQILLMTIKIMVFPNKNNSAEQ